MNQPPLAERLRPVELKEILGQDHLLGEGGPLSEACRHKKLHSMVLWGPPGCGKTTLARLLASTCGAELISISAVLGGVKDIRDAVERAQALKDFGKTAVVFVDEVHRFNKAQQDAFLPHVESGLFVFIGATTENPSFELNNALLSRAPVYVLKPLEDQALDALISRGLAAFDGPRGLIDQAARQSLIRSADGDARRLLGLIELSVQAALAAKTKVDQALLDRMLPALSRRFDKGGDEFYDQISALHKSVRGSDPDASLYWLARMLDGGCDPRYIARRLVRMAVEDIGLADPRALTMTLEAAHAYERLGSPEGELALAQATVFLACSAKSNAAYLGFKAAQKFVAENGSLPVPAHLRNAPTALTQSLGHGRGYRYSQNEPGGFSAGQDYFPDALTENPPRFYEPVDRGMESKISQKLSELRQMNDTAKKIKHLPKAKR